MPASDSDVMNSLLVEMQSSVDAGDLGAAVMACQALNASLETGLHGIDDVTALRSASLRVSQVTERVTTLRSELKHQLKASLRKREGVAAYKTANR